MKVWVSIRPSRYPPKPPSIDKSDKAVVVCILKESGDDLFNKERRFVDFPASSVVKPRNYMLKLWRWKHCVQFCRKFLDPNRDSILINGREKGILVCRSNMAVIFVCEGVSVFLSSWSSCWRQSLEGNGDNFSAWCKVFLCSLLPWTNKHFIRVILTRGSRHFALKLRWIWVENYSLLAFWSEPWLFGLLWRLCFRLLSRPQWNLVGAFSNLSLIWWMMALQLHKGEHWLHGKFPRQVRFEPVFIWDAKGKFRNIVVSYLIE